MLPYEDHLVLVNLVLTSLHMCCCFLKYPKGMEKTYMYIDLVSFGKAIRTKEFTKQVDV